MMPRAVLLQCGAQHNTLVRLTLKLPEQEHPGHYQLIDSIRSSLPDQLAVAAVPFAATINSIQYVCHKGAAAKLYKALGGLKQQLHFELEDVRSSITLQPMSLRLLDGVATAAISCSLRHAVSNPNSDGGRTSTNSSRARLQLYPSRTWHMLRPDCYISTDIAAAQPGALCHALYVELEVAAQQPDKMLINFLRAGAVKFQLFSPMQALMANASGSSLPSPLAASDTDGALLACPDKLRAANRLLRGHRCSVLPNLATAVVIKVHGPPSPAALQQLQQHWLQQHALQLPDSIPFQLELAAHAESVDTLLVPSCCVLTSLGLAEVLPNAPEYVSAREVQQLVVRDVCEGGGCALWGTKPPVALGPEKSAASTAGPAAAAAKDPPPPAATFTYKTAWSKASALVNQDLTLLQLEAVAGSGTPPAAAKSLGAASSAAGWMTAGRGGVSSSTMEGMEQALEDVDVGLQPDVDPGEAAAGGRGGGGGGGGRRERPPRPTTDFSHLKAFLAKRMEQQAAAATASLTSQPPKAAAPLAAANKGKAGTTTPAGAAALTPAAAGGGGAAAGASGMTLQQRLAAAKAGSVEPGKPAAPALRKAPTAGAAAAAAKPATKPAGAKRPPNAAAAAKPPKKPRADAATKAAAAAAAAAAAGVQAPGAAPPAAVVDAGLIGLTMAPTAAAPAGTLPPTPSAAGTGAAAPAAAAARKRTKAADLDLEVVTAKLRAAVAGGGVFKGVSVPELQCYLKAHKLGVSGKKADLEAKVVAHMMGSGAALAPGGPGAAVGAAV